MGGRDFFYCFPPHTPRTTVTSFCMLFFCFSGCSVNRVPLEDVLDKLCTTDHTGCLPSCIEVLRQVMLVYYGSTASHFNVGTTASRTIQTTADKTRVVRHRGHKDVAAYWAAVTFLEPFTQTAMVKPVPAASVTYPFLIGQWTYANRTSILLTETRSSCQLGVLDAANGVLEIFPEYR
jgi:hypothetical protein